MNIVVSWLSNTLILWSVIGIIATFLVSILARVKAKGGFIASLLFSIGGAFLGGLLANILLNQETSLFNTVSLLPPIAGAIVLGFMHKFIFREQQQFRTKVTN